MKRSKILKKTCIYIILFAASILFLFPIYWIIITSFKDKGMIYTTPPVFFPAGFSFENYLEAFELKPILGQFVNSLSIAMISTILSVAVSVMAGYGFSRYQFRGRIAAMYSVLIVKMVPGMILLIPYYLMFQKMELLNTSFSLIISYTAINLPFAIWLIMGFFDDVPVEIFESGKIDGCNDWQVFTKLALPFAIPGVIATSILCFIYSWNEFAIALVLTYSENVQTLPISISGFLDTQTATPMGALAAVGVMALVPTLAISLFTQRYLVSGLSAGAVKG